MGKKRKTRVRTNNNDMKLSQFLNDLTFNDYYNRLKKIATSIFEWENLPNSCDEDYLENSLFETGIATILLDNNQIPINTDATSNGYINLYNLPTKLNCMSANGQNYYRDLYVAENQDINKTCILIKNTKDMQATSTTVELFAYRLFVAERTLDINAHSLRTPFFITCNQNQLMTVKNIMSQIEGFEPKIVARKDNLDEYSIEVLKTDTPFLLDKLEIYKEKIWNEALTFLGVNNISTEKQERLITDEAKQNNELINLNLQSFLKPRKKACKQYNDLFKPDKPLNVKVNSDLENIIKTQFSTVSNFRENEVVEDE